MNFTNIKPNYSPHDIPENIDKLGMFSKYLGTDIKLNTLYKCPMPNHTDSTPSFTVRVFNNDFIFKCFGCGRTGNLLSFVRDVNNITHQEAINLLVREFGLRGGVIYRKPKLISSKPIEIEILPTYRVWNLQDMEYWGLYSIPLSKLNEYDVKPCKTVYIKKSNGDYFQYGVHLHSNPIYCFEIGDKIKIYRPLTLNKKQKWYTNATMSHLQGYKQLPEKGEILLITSSLKDCIVLNMMGYPAVAANSETSKIPGYYMEELRSRFSKLILFNDNDEAGINASKVLSNYYKIPYILLPDLDTKDISDSVKLHGFEYSKSILKEIIEEKLNE